MRDPKRIPVVLELVRELWEKHPDWRLGQLVVNVSSRDDPFYAEDDEMENALKEAIDKYRDFP